MVRYLRSELSAPVAIINALKWMGFPSTSKDIKRISALCDDGVPFALYELLHGLRNQPKIFYNLTPDVLRMYLRERWAVLMQSDGKYFLITDVTKGGGKFHTVPFGWITKSKMKDLCTSNSYGLVICKINDGREPRYLSQQDNYSCCPVAIINAFKWIGFPATGQEHLHELRNVCGTDKDGTSNSGVHAGVRHMCDKFNLPSKHIRYKSWPSMSFIDNELDKGNGILACYLLRRDKENKRPSAHATFISWKDTCNECFEMVNFVSTLAADLVFREELKAIVRRCQSAWVFNHQGSYHAIQ